MINIRATKFVLPALLGLAALSHAQTATPTKIAVIQMQAALATTKDGQKALDELQTRMVEPKRKEIEGQQASLKDLQDRLQRGVNTLAQAAKDSLQRDIDAKSKNLNRDMQDAQEELEQEQGKIVNDLMTKMNPVLTKYLTDNNFAILLDVSDPQRSGVFWASTAIDITQAVVELYDKSAPAPAATKPVSAAKPAATPVKPVTAAKPPAAAPAK